MPKKAAPAPVGDRRYRQALELFEKAVKAFGKKDFERARGHLNSLVESHADQPDLVERSRSYLAMCDRATSRKNVRPKTFEEILNYGVVLHNRGEFDEAVKYLRQAVAQEPRNEHALYCLAASEARAGGADAALQALRSAISANPTSRTQARLDPDFEPLRGEAEFQALVAPTLS